MKLSVLSLGYVGPVSAGCLAETLIDFVRITDSRSVSGIYEGICW